jgi:hypothetical protein
LSILLPPEPKIYMYLFGKVCLPEGHANFG